MPSQLATIMRWFNNDISFINLISAINVVFSNTIHRMHYLIKQIRNRFAKALDYFQFLIERNV